MSVTQLYLVRHGETDWNAEGRFQGQLNSNLTETGMQQARVRSEEMRAMNFAAKYCSTSDRTRQTIHGLLDGEVNSVEYRDELREIMLGPWQGKLSKEMALENPEQYAHYTKAPDQFQLAGAETFRQLQNRGVNALEKIADAHQGQQVLVVSHGAIIKASLLHWMGWPLAQIWEKPNIPNCSCSVLEFSGERAVRVLRIADIEL